MIKYNINQIEASYDFDSCITFVNGRKSVFHKTENIQIKKNRGGYEFLMLGSNEETLNGKTPDEFDAIILEFGKALYPMSLQVSEKGDFLGINDFNKLKDHWMTRRREIVEYYENFFPIKKQSYRYSLALDSEDKFYNILKENMFYRLLFWQEESPKQEVIIRDFPQMERLSIFTFQGTTETYAVRDEGSGRLVSGHAKIHILRDDDGLPNEIKLWARVEEQDTGYFTKEITIKRR